MDLTLCPHCNKRMKAVATTDGRTGLQCLPCERAELLTADTAKWAAASKAPPTKAA